MSHIEGFDSMDEMFAAMAAHEDTANRGLTPGQIRLRDDVENTGYWAQPIPDWDLVIYGKVDTVQATIDAGADFDVTDNRERGYLTGIAHSPAAERGEHGDTHVSQVVPISAEIYADAERLGWPTWTQLMESVEGRALGRRMAQAEEEMRR